MNIAVFQNSCPAPSEIFVYNQVRHLKYLGHNPLLFAYRNKNSTRDFKRWFNSQVDIPIIHPPRIPPWITLRFVFSLFLALRLPRGLQLFRATHNFAKFGWWAQSEHLFYWAYTLKTRAPALDIIHAHFAPVAGIPSMLRECSVLKAPLVVSLHGADVTSHESMDHITTGLYQHVWNNTALFTYNSSFIRERAVYMGFDDKKMRHLPVPIGKDFEQQILLSQRSPEQEFQIISVGRMVEKKGYFTGLHAFHLFHQKHPHSRLVLVGDGPLKPQIKQMIRELDLTDVVDLLGSRTQTEIRQLMLQSHVLLFPSETASNGDMEGQGLVVQEAQACGIPVIVTQHNGVPDGMLDQISGFVVNERDHDDMALHLSILYNNPMLAISMGASGRTFAVANYNSTTLTERLIQIYQEAIQCEVNDYSNC